MPCRSPVAVRRAAVALAVLAPTVAGALASAAAASAHAQLLGTSPVSGSTVRAQPRTVIFEFNQNVGGTLGAVRVYDAQGREVDDLDVSHPGGNERWMAVGLRPHLPDGTYTATYRVVSADTHVVYGGLVFAIGHAGAAPKFTVAGLLARNRTGPVTTVAFAVVRGLDYLALALALGGLAFLFVAWAPAQAAVAGAEPRWPAASRAFATRLRALLAAAVALGVLVSVLGVLLQGATAAGVSLWGSLKGAVIDDTLAGRFGEVWGARALVWVALGVLLLGARASGRDVIPVLRPDAGGAAGSVAGEAVARATPRRAPRAVLALLALGCAYLTLTPALAGHASVQSPTGVFLPADALHVLGASVWVGGVACLLLALPGATRRLEGPERSRLLWAVLARFSPLALGAVTALAATGAIQAYIDVRTLDGLLHTTYGALVIAKVLLVLALTGLGWVNRKRVIPLLGRLAGAGGAPGATGVLARRTMRAELGLMACVFGVTAALVGYAPPIDAVAGPFSTDATLGPAELEMTVEPARVGLNTIHLYLIDARSGVQFTATRELTATARLPAEGIGPLPLHANLAGPGHYILTSAVLSPGGTWSIEIADRVSEFEQYTRVVKVPIR
jgi:copper transport protein